MSDSGRYADPTGHFALSVPTDWDVYESYNGTLVTIAEPPPSVPDFAANVNVLHYPNDRALDGHALVSESIETMAVLLTDFVLLEQDLEDERPRLLFTFRQGIHGLTAEQCYVLGDGEYYVVTGTMKNGADPEQEATISAVLDSFTILEAWAPAPT